MEAFRHRGVGYQILSSEQLIIDMGKTVSERTTSSGVRSYVFDLLNFAVSTVPTDDPDILAIRETLHRVGPN